MLRLTELLYLVGYFVSSDEDTVVIMVAARQVCSLFCSNVDLPNKQLQKQQEQLGETTTKK